jgi:hypothetical protein
MAVWIVVFVILFALAQFFDWIQGFSLPLPLSILGGVVLAIAANYQRLSASFIPANFQDNYAVSQQVNNFNSVLSNSENQEILPNNHQNQLPNSAHFDVNKNM